MRSRTVWSLLALLAVVFAMPGRASEESAFTRMMERYEAIRLALLADGTEGIAGHAQAIREEVISLTDDFSAARAGVPQADVDECRRLLPELSAAAAHLAEVENLEQAREALFELSKPLGRYRKLAGTEGSVVVYCSMARKAWIQPEGTLGNPYMGQSMPRCGRVVPD